jgi:hypothetical protein
VTRHWAIVGLITAALLGGDVLLLAQPRNETAQAADPEPTERELLEDSARELAEGASRIRQRLEDAPPAAAPAMVTPKAADRRPTPEVVRDRSIVIARDCPARGTSGRLRGGYREPGCDTRQAP